MIIVDLPEIERISDLLITISNDTDEMLGRQRSLLKEMDEDVQLSEFPQSKGAMESLEQCIKRTFELNESVHSLQSIMMLASEDYKENEKKFASRMDELMGTLNTLQFNLSAAVSAELIPIEKDEEELKSAGIQKMVAQSSTEMELINIAAVSKAIEEEYCIADVKTNGKILKELEGSAVSTESSAFAAMGIKTDIDEDFVDGVDKILKDIDEKSQELGSTFEAAENITVKGSAADE